MAKTKGEAPTKNKVAPVKVEEITWAKVEEEAARAKTEKETIAKAEQEERAKAEKEAREALARADQVAPEEEARARAEEEAQSKADQEARVIIEEDARINTEQETRIKAEVEARAEAEQEARVKAEEEAGPGFRELGKEQLKSATTTATFVARSFEAITTETIDYAKKSLDTGFAFVEKLLGTRSFQSTIYIQSEYAKTSYTDFVAYLTKIGELNGKLSKEVFKRRSHVS
jgi:Phasin protein